MYVMTSGRQSGKTYALIQWLLHDPYNRTIVVRDAKRADRLARQVETLTRGSVSYRQALDRMVCTYNELEEHKERGRTAGQYAIDDAEVFLQAYLRRWTSGTLEFVTFKGVPVAPPMLTYFEQERKPQEEQSA